MRIPSYRKHSSGQARVSINGRDYLLGPFNSKESKAKYKRLVGEWIASQASCSFGIPADQLTVSQLLLAYLNHVKSYYGTGPTSELHRIKPALSAVRAVYGASPAASFGPLQFKAVRETLAREGDRSRKYVNSLCEKIKRMFRWAAAEALIPATNVQAINLVPPLKEGRTELRENDPVLPVSDEVVEATLPHLSQVVGDMVRFQRLTGCRPGEVCAIQPAMVDRSSDVWEIRLRKHKTSHRGKSRVIYVSKPAQAILSPYLIRAADAYCFSPKDASRQLLLERKENRVTPLSCGNSAGTNRKSNPNRVPGHSYTTGSYGRAVARACERAFPPPPELKDADQIRSWNREHAWAPNQLRHSFATRVRREHGLEVASILLGHSDVGGNGFKAQVVCFDRECCVLYKAAMDEIISPEASAIVMSSAQKDPQAWSVHLRDKDAEEKLLDRFRDPADPLKFVIVTSKLLTGFDAPILQAMYLDKPMKDHNLLQAICRVNRTYGQTKTHGLIVDYIGIFDDVAVALDFDEKAVQQVVSNIDELRQALPVQMQKCRNFFPNVDRSLGGYEGLMSAQQHLPDNATRDKFASEYTVLGTIWESLSPDPCLSPYETDFKWLTQVYESVKPVSGNGRLLWHRLGAKTIELINENVHVEAVRDDIEALVLDADVLDSILKDANPSKKAREVEIKLIARLRKHAGNPQFKELGERLEKIREKHEQGLLNSLEFLKAILEVAKDTVEAEKHIEPEAEQDRALAALTELFNEAKGKHTHVIVERIVADIDAIVKQVRFDGWQATAQGEREVKQALRRALLKYKLHTDQELFEKAYGYIRQYY